MDETTKQALNTFAQQMITAAQTGAQWTSEQAPLVVQEWLRWQLAEAALIAAAALTAAVVLAITTKRLSPCDEWDRYFPLNLFTAIGALSCLIPFAVNTMIAVKVLVAPRVVVLEKFMELVK